MPGGHILAGAVNDVTNLLGAIALLAIGVPIALALLITARRGLKRVELSAGSMHLAAEAVVAEMNPNGGKTLRDAVDRIEHRVIAIDDRLTAVEEAVTRPSKEHTP